MARHAALVLVTALLISGSSSGTTAQEPGRGRGAAASRRFTPGCVPATLRAAEDRLSLCAIPP